MQQDAESHAEEDKKKRELIEARNEADSRCYQLEKLIKEQGRQAQGRRQEVARSGDEQGPRGGQGRRRRGDQVRPSASWSMASHAMSEALYKAASAAGAAGAEGAAPEGGSSADDDAIDAEFEVKK